MTAPTNLSFNPGSIPPRPEAAPDGWRLTVDLARFGELEDGTPALAILLDIESEPGASMDIWLSSESGTLAHWSGGSTEDYRGDVCFQLPLASEDGSHAIPLSGTLGHTLTVAFFNDEGTVILSVSRGIANFAPDLRGVPAESSVFRDLLACP